MKKLKKVYTELNESSNHMNSGGHLEDYERHDKFLLEYLKTGKKEFVRRWYDDFFEKDCELIFNVEDLLSSKKRFAYKYADAFIKQPNIGNFQNLIDSFYPLTLSSILTYNNKSKNFFDKNELALLFFTSLSYYPQDEIELLFKGFNYYVIREDFKESKKMDAKGTLFPLVYSLANDYLKDVNDSGIKRLIEEGLKEFHFSDLYNEAYNNFLSQDEAIVKNIFDDMCDYHLQKSIRTDDYYPEFEYGLYQAIPWEIIVLLRLRSKNNLDNSFINHPLIDPFIPFVSKDFDNVLSSENQTLRNKVFNDFSLSI